MTKKETFRIYCATGLFLIIDGKLLLMKRQNTGFGDGWWAIPGGSIDGGEPMKEALIREAKEELGITLDPADVTYASSVHIAPHFRTPREVLLFCFHASRYSGTLTNMEPDKCEEIRFFDLDNLPENRLEGGALALDNFFKGIPFAEMHWDLYNK